MKIYAVRDRVLDFLMNPFIGESDKHVMHSLSAVINNEGSNHAIAQAPKDFDLYQLGTITDEGHVLQEYRIVCSCSSLVRGSVRDGAAPAGGPVPQPMELSAEQTGDRTRQ